MSYIWQDFHQRRRDSDLDDPLGFAGNTPVKRASAGEDNNANWIFTYSDMITLLLAFFIIMASVSKPDEERYAKIQKSLATSLGIQSQNPIASKNVKFAKKQPVLHPGQTAPNTNSSDQTAQTMELPAEMAAMGVILTALNKVIVDEGLAQDVKILSNKGMATITFNESVFFSIGAAEFSNAAKPFLKKIAHSLSKLNESFLIEVEGHTDDQPIVGNRHKFPTNWELSTARATQVVRFFLVNGLQPKQLVAKGLADTHPIAPNRTQDGLPIKANQEKNRRVVLRIIANSQDGGGL